MNMTIDWDETVVCCPDNPETRSGGCGGVMRLVAVSCESNRAMIDPGAHLMVPMDPTFTVIWRCRCGMRFAKRIGA